MKFEAFEIKLPHFEMRHLRVTIDSLKIEVRTNIKFLVKFVCKKSEIFDAVAKVYGALQKSTLYELLNDFQVNGKLSKTIPAVVYLQP